MKHPIHEEAALKLHLEQMQRKLYKLVEQKGTFLAPEVIELSQEIDSLIVTLQRNMRKQSSL
ncbi:aspartyl-phosphate phosphatase Spo0E family protein [Paenibacillus piri]|uniref:Aspartyl-phosphate phosphatase Spo0E family protein n=1 Tax=Paenibacillus piri TaxID=2547395 RepID=A0A4R5KXB2_9BACL|nr:aspartyl-phosphate phosphatase Spo0E family protein [Paenibacillus piri]TDF99697.1 aspartyl-phosphate phosphatase Spo0E family protein [Paenibacillus piri]